MASNKREKTKYPGVYYRTSPRLGKEGEERIFYIVFKKNGKMIEEKVGRQYADAMTAAKAAGIRASRVEGKLKSRKELREEKEAAQKAEAERPTIERLWTIYRQSLPGRNRWDTDDSLYAKYLAAKFACKEPNSIYTLDMDELRNSLLEQGKSAQTAKHVLALLRRIIRFGVKKGLCPPPDPSKLYFEMPTVNNQKTESLSAKQLKKYLAALDAEEDQNAAALLRLALVTGMRKGALLGLQWNDIDFEKGFITLRGDIAKKGKTERIPLSASARDVLSKVEHQASPYVFPGKDGQKRQDFRRVAVRVKKNAGLPEDFRPLHGLRHAYASLLASSGKVDLYTLQKLLTHESPQMTQRYAHLADEALQRAASVVDQTFMPAENNDKKGGADDGRK